MILITKTVDGCIVLICIIKASITQQRELKTMIGQLGFQASEKASTMCKRNKNFILEKVLAVHYNVKRM